MSNAQFFTLAHYKFFITQRFKEYQHKRQSLQRSNKTIMHLKLLSSYKMNLWGKIKKFQRCQDSSAPFLGCDSRRHFISEWKIQEQTMLAHTKNDVSNLKENAEKQSVQLGTGNQLVSRTSSKNNNGILRKQYNSSGDKY